MKFLWIVQSSYKGDNSPPQQKGRACPVLFAVAEEDIGERTAPQNGSGKETIVLCYFIEAQKIIGGAGSAARGRIRERNAASFARRFRLTPKSVLARRSLAPVLFGDPEILMANIPQHSTFWKRRASSSLKIFSANQSTLDRAKCPERGNTVPLLPFGLSSPTRNRGQSSYHARQALVSYSHLSWRTRLFQAAGHYRLRSPRGARNSALAN